MKKITFALLALIAAAMTAPAMADNGKHKGEYKNAKKNKDKDVIVVKPKAGIVIDAPKLSVKIK